VFTVLGETYILAPDGSLTHVCPCAASCARESAFVPTVVTETVTPPTPPTGTPVTPTPDTPTPETPTEPPPPEARCNRGVGNGAEDCDPGNSYGQGHGHASGEDVGE